MPASVSFPLLLNLNNKRLAKLCPASFVVLMVSSLLRSLTDKHHFLFDINGGWSTETILEDITLIDPL